MQPSEYEIQREVEALRDLRRRSVTPGALSIDPDLPNQSPPSTPTSGYWTGQSSSTNDGDSSSSHEDSSSSENSHPNNPADDPFHLFWVPASLHPEIAPAEFRAFLKEHARSPPSSDGVATPERSNSVSSTSSSLGRKKSMLSRQYRPSEHDGVEEETVVPLRRNRTSVLRANVGPQLTISDLQKLEELAEEASESDDPTKLRNILRRSLSLNMSPSVVEKMGDMPDMGDEADTPIIVPPPGQILRRAARTKIRKPGLPGDGGGHRFGSTRRGPRAPGQVTAGGTSVGEPRTSSDMSSSDHGDSIGPSAPPQRARTFSNESMNNRPESYSEESSIYDAYARDDDEETAAPIVVTSPPPPVFELPLSPPLAEPTPEIPEPPAPILHHPQPQRLIVPQAEVVPQSPSRTPSPQPSPETSPPRSLDGSSPSQPPPSFLSTSPSPTHAHHQQRKEKDKKGLFGKWGADKGGKKSNKDKERENRERAEKEKESGFFGSLFGSKKKQDEPSQPSRLGTASGRETAQALLGASKSSKSYVPSPSPILPPGSNPYARYPIHVERAIYRLSHIKLANPRRPLYEQVLISNLMFWYLGVINKTTSPGSPPNGQAAAGTGTQNGPMSEKDTKEREQKEKEKEEQRQKAEKERLEKERIQKEKEIELKKKESPRRGPLTKPPAAGAARRAEMPVRGPQYEMQHRVMEQEYGGHSNQSSGTMGRSNSGAPSMGPGQQYPPRVQSVPPQLQLSGATGALKLVQPQPQSANEFYYSGNDFMQTQKERNLPPGAMPPPSTDQTPWGAPPSPPVRMNMSSSPPLASADPHRRSRSPPQSNKNVQPLVGDRQNLEMQGTQAAGYRLQGRSLSATASPSPPLVNGKLRKGISAHAVVPSAIPRRYVGDEPGVNGHGTGTGEEEDVPLALWQQRRR